MAGKDTQTPSEETNRQKFERLAVSRTTKALDAIGLIEQLANPSRYEYGVGDTDQIEKALTEAVGKAISALRNGKVQTASFSLSANSAE